MTENPAITKAYETGEYVDANGVKWVRGMDGWFDYSDPRIVRLEYSGRMNALIEQENPVKPVEEDTTEEAPKKTRASRKDKM